MQTPSRMLVLVLGLALLIGFPSAFVFNATVENNVGTRLPGTKVQVLMGDTVLYANTTKWCPKIDVAGGCPSIIDRAVARFDLANGVYFVRLQRGGYPDHVYFLNITQDLEVKYVMYIQKSTYTLYGKVSVNPEHWVGRKISLVDQQDTVVRSITIVPDGYFIIDSVWPATNYYLRLDDGTQRIISPVFQAPDAGAGYMEISGATTETNNTILAPKLTASSNAALYSILSAQLKAGERPMVGQPVLVSTPRGTLNLSTDETGKVYVQAAMGGDYTFTWETQVVKMSVPKPAAPPAVKQNNTAPETPSVPITPPEQGSGAAAGNAPTMMLGTASLLLVAVIAVIAVVFIFIVVPRLMKMANKATEKKEEPAAPMWPKPAEPQMESGSQEHAHKESHAHAQHKHKAAAKHHRKKH